MKKEFYEVYIFDDAREMLAHVPLGTEQAKGWLTTHADILRDSGIVLFAPKPEYYGKIPTIKVCLSEGQQLVYHRTIRGKITLEGGRTTNRQKLFYVFGYVGSDGIEHTIEVRNGRETIITMGE